MTTASAPSRLWEATGVVEAPVEAVAALVLDVPAGPQVAVDRERRSLATWGDWWFRGETTLDAHPRGTRLVYRVFNIAQSGRWLVPLVYLQTRRQIERDFDATLTGLGARLGCAAYRLPRA